MVPVPEKLYKHDIGRAMGLALWTQLLSELAVLLHVIRDVALYKPWASPPESPPLRSGAHFAIDFLGKALGR